VTEHCDSFRPRLIHSGGHWNKGLIDELLECLGVERFPLEKFLGHQIHLGAMLFPNVFRVYIGFIQDCSDFLVDLTCSLLIAIAVQNSVTDTIPLRFEVDTTRITVLSAAPLIVEGLAALRTASFINAPLV
jgi:hypothetical protein